MNISICIHLNIYLCALTPDGDIADDEDSKDKKRTCGSPPDVLGALAYRGDQLVATDMVK